MKFTHPKIVSFISGKSINSETVIFNPVANLCRVFNIIIVSPAPPLLFYFIISEQRKVKISEHKQTSQTISYAIYGYKFTYYSIEFATSFNTSRYFFITSVSLSTSFFERPIFSAYSLTKVFSFSSYSPSA